jgi:hypothetical protein
LNARNQTRFCSGLRNKAQWDGNWLSTQIESKVDP